MANLIYKELSYKIIGAAMEVHSTLGAGFLESVYQTALAHEMTLRGISFEQHKRLSVDYKGVCAGNYETDFVVENKIILELKALSNLHSRHEAQTLNYLAATNLRLAILLNFGEESLKYKRLVR